MSLVVCERLIIVVLSIGLIGLCIYYNHLIKNARKLIEGLKRIMNEEVKK